MGEVSVSIEDLTHENSYSMNWVCSNCGSSGVEGIEKGTSAIGAFLCDICECLTKHYVRGFGKLSPLKAGKTKEDK